MLIIAIGYGPVTDPYSCSYAADHTEVNPDILDSVLNHIMTKQSLRKKWIDELLVVEGDIVIAHYGADDGLGAWSEFDSDDEDTEGDSNV